MAAAYELTPLKNVCLSKCRSPLGLLLGSWRDGWSGALRMGMRNGAWCVGCCWALMASLFALGVMSAVWMAVVAGLIALEKTPSVAPDRDLRHGDRPPRPRCAGARCTGRTPRSHNSGAPCGDQRVMTRAEPKAPGQLPSYGITLDDPAVSSVCCRFTTEACMHAVSVPPACGTAVVLGLAGFGSGASSSRVLQAILTARFSPGRVDAGIRNAQPLQARRHQVVVLWAGQPNSCTAPGIAD